MDPATAKMALQITATLARSRAARWAVVAVVLGALLSLGATIATPSVLAAQIAGNTRTQGSLGADTDPACLTGSVPASAQWSIEQATNAKTIWTVAHQLKMGDQGAVVGLATAMQESTLRALDYGDTAGPDSRGLFQQRAPWGPLEDRMDPVKSSRLFYRALAKIRGWQQLPVTVAAQRVQISAYPNAYAKWEDDARVLVATMNAAGTSCDEEETPAGGGPVPADFDRQGNPRTVEQAIAWIQANAPQGAAGEPVRRACERYMNLAYGLGGGYPTALAHWNAAGPRSVGSSSVPPRGALVFWRTSDPAGHVGLSLGDGIVASTDYNPVTHLSQGGTLGIGPIGDIDRWGPRLGWRAPNFRVGSGR